MRSVERNLFIGDLIRMGLGTKEVEDFIVKQERLRMGWMVISWEIGTGERKTNSKFSNGK